MELDKQSIMDAIDTMVVYDCDYSTIRKILDTEDYELIETIVEEVLRGNLYWSDFETLFPESYRDTLGETIENQKNLRTRIIRLANLRQKSNAKGESYNTIKDANLLLQQSLLPEGIIKYTDDNGNVDSVWAEGYRQKRDDLIYGILQAKSSDTVLERAYKEKLLNAIMNGKWVYSDANGIQGKLDALNADDTEYSYSYDNMHIIKKDKTTGLEVDRFIVINPDDILFSVDDYIVPSNYEYQELTAADKVFMEQNKLTSDEVKKMKSLYYYIEDLWDEDKTAGGD